MRVTKIIVEINEGDFYEESLKVARQLACQYSCEVEITLQKGSKKKSFTLNGYTSSLLELEIKTVSDFYKQSTERS